MMLSIEVIRFTRNQRILSAFVVLLNIAVALYLLFVDSQRSPTHDRSFSFPHALATLPPNASQSESIEVGSSSRTREIATLASAMAEIIRLLIPEPSTANEYLAQHEPKTFRFYVYDNLSHEYTWQYSASCMKAKRRLSDTCDWGESVCGEKRLTRSPYSKRRLNRNGDLVLSKAFSSYQGILRTYDPIDADLFVVPYPSQAHFHCNQTSHEDVETRLLDRLAYFNKKTRRKHLFFSSAVRSASNKFMGSLPLLVTIGPVDRQCRIGRNCGQIVMPYVNTNPEYQPIVVQKNLRSLKDRKFAMVAKFNAYISGNSMPRSDFLKVVGNVTAIAGFPVLISALGQRRTMPNERSVLEDYRNAIFCPCLRGDEPPQKRLFDVMMSGCIPVVLDFPSKDPGYRSHFASMATSTRGAYPFAKGSFHGWPEMGLDYNEFMVTVNGTCGVSCIVPTLEDLLLNHRDRLVNMQERLAKVIKVFSYGMEHNTLQHADAISAILVQVKHYVDSLGQVS